MPATPAPLVLLNVVGLTPRWLGAAPRLSALAEAGWSRPMREAFPAVTCTAQASMLTGAAPSVHGIVANGWLYRDTREVRFWQQSNALIQAEPLYATARMRAAQMGRPFRCAKLFWWFNQGAEVDISVTPKPHYGADGNKVFGISATPAGLAGQIESRIGPFPFPSFWGPRSGIASTEWIARCAAEIIKENPPDLTLAYLPHLDYEPQRRGPGGTDMRRRARELDDAAHPLLAAAKRIGARVWVVSEYGHVDVRRPVLINAMLRQANLLAVRGGPFGEQLDTFESEAFAVCDHQIAHVYVKNRHQLERIRHLLEGLAGVAAVYGEEQRAQIGLDHARSGELIAVAQTDAWFAYPFWLDDGQAPDYARTIDIHRKPGFDPCELFFDPKLWWPMGRMLVRLAQKKLGFRTLFDVIGLDATLVRGSHGLPAGEEQDRPLLIGDGPAPAQDVLAQDVRELVLGAMGLL
jgi:predicted AlkP superfamily pyrophosphatase or phosphodiesterase